MVRNLICVLLFGVLLGACRSEDESSKIFVTEIEITQCELFAPGDLVTVRAAGFEPQDRIMLSAVWPLAGEMLAEGYYKGLAVERERTADSITFLAPGGCPASRVDILLFREGRTQLLGTIRVSDGQAPERYALYGIRSSDEGDTYVDRIDIGTGAATEAMRIEGVDALRCPVNEYGTNRIYGLGGDGTETVGLFCDLTMRYWSDSAPQQYVAVGAISSTVGYLRHHQGQLWLERLSDTRTSPVQPAAWTLPDDVTPEMLASAPFCTVSNRILLLSADRGDGTFSPVMMALPAAGNAVRVGDGIAAGALIPFATIDRREENGVSKADFVGGFVVSAPGGPSELRLFDPVSGFSEPFATLDDAVLSVSVDLDSEEQFVYLLTEDAQGCRRIRVYDRRQHTWRTLPGAALPYRAIVLAR